MNLEDLGRRAVACKRWRWMEGMQVEPLRFRVVWLTEDMIGESDQTSYFWKNVPDIYPDLSDPATLGCLLALVQEAWNACRISVCFSAYTPDATKRWSVPISYFKEQRDLVHVPSFYGTTQAEALVAALEAAP